MTNALVLLSGGLDSEHLHHPGIDTGNVDGSTGFEGYDKIFVRLTGCPLRCGYCDTAYAFSGGELMTSDAILDTVRSKGVRHVTVTGGEPLAQPVRRTKTVGNPVVLVSPCRDRKISVIRS